MPESLSLSERRRPGTAPGGPRQPVARRRDRRREDRPHPPERRGAALLRAPGVLRRPRPAPEGRAHVALRGGRQRGHRRGRPRRGDLQGRGAGPAHRRARARAPGRRARRGHGRGALPRAQARAGLRDPDAGDLHALRLGGRLRHRHAPARRRRRAGHDRLPLRPAARHGRLARAAARRRLQRGRGRADLRRTSPSRRTTSAASARCTSASPRAPEPRSRRARCSTSSRARCPRRSTSS